MPSAKRSKPTATGLPLIDALSANANPTIDDYVKAVSQYVVESISLDAAVAKRAQIALGNGLARVLAAELQTADPKINPYPGERTVAGALRTARADVSESHSLDGLRLAVEIKPVNLAVGRAMWNRFGDIRTFAVNIHLKFPFAVVGGVLAIPTWEWGKSSRKLQLELVDFGEDAVYHQARDTTEDGYGETAPEDLDLGGSQKKETVPLIERLILRLTRTPMRTSEAGPAHLLEAVAVIVYDPDTGELHPNLPPVGSGLRWDEFIHAMAQTYDLRFE